MKQALISAGIAAVVALFVVLAARGSDDTLNGDAATGTNPVPLTLSYTTEIIEDAIVNGARYTGAEPKLLAEAGNSICYLTKIQIKAMQTVEDSSTCMIDIDEFTGFWQVTAIVDEGGTAEVHCNARCLVWE